MKKKIEKLWKYFFFLKKTKKEKDGAFKIGE